MKTIYWDQGHRAVDFASIDLVDACWVGLGGSVITRIYTTPSLRGQGRASRLLEQVCADADAEGVTLYLEINPYGGLSGEQLEEWYARKGFRFDGAFWCRQPHKKEGN